MINNAKAESDVRSARGGGDGSDCGSDVKRSSVPSGESEGEGSGYEDDFDGIRRA